MCRHAQVDAAADAAIAAAGDDESVKRHWAVSAQKLMRAASPTSLVVTHRAIEEGGKLPNLGEE